MTTTPRTSGLYKRAVGLFYSRDEAERAIQALKTSGFSMDRVSLIARNADKVAGAEDLNESSGNEAQEGAGIGAVTGTVLGGIGGLLVGIGALAVPGVGPLVFAGEVSALATTLAGAGIGAASGSLIGALTGLGIPEGQAQVYNDRIKGGSYLLMVTGTEDEIRRAEPILRDRGIEEFDIYDAPDLGNAATTQTTPTTGRVVTEPRRAPVAGSDPDVMIVDKREGIRE